MEVQYYGANCIRITTKKANIVIDGIVGTDKKSFIKAEDVALFTDDREKKEGTKARLLINQPGEYEVADTSILGIPARSYADEAKTFGNTIFKIECEDVKLAVIGNIHPKLTDSQLELLGQVDVIVIPVGDNDTTLSGLNALDIIKNIEPYIVIPTYFADKKTSYKSSPTSLEEALKDLAMEVSETVPKIKFKSANFIEGENTKLVVLEN